MTNNPEQIRADIESTRRELGQDVDALADKVTPSKMVQRQTDKVKGAFGTAKDRVMGLAEEASSSTGDQITNAPHKMADATRGNPLAVGLIAFGVGWLASSLMPASEKEKQLASQVKDAAQPLVEQVSQVAGDVAENLREPAKEAAASVKDKAGEAAESVKSEASGASDQVKQDATEATRVVGGQQRP